MDFSLLFSIVSALSFTIEFAIDGEKTQDYFLFGGNNNSAHLFRENKTLYLQLSRKNGKTYSIYDSGVNEGKFEFSWNGFLVDGRKMKMLRSNGNITKLDFEHFTFLSPLVDIFQLECSDAAFYNCKDVINYWYFAAILVVVGIVFDSKTSAINILRRLFIKSQAFDSDDDYVSMEYDSNQQQKIENESNV